MIEKELNALEAEIIAASFLGAITKRVKASV
jgi:hypothetical protein